MSETVHYKGTLKPTGKTVSEYVKEKCSEIPEYYDDEKEYFDDTFYYAAVEVSGQVYEVEKEDIDPDYDIFIASKNDDESISFEVKYYNGGCSFTEAIETSILPLWRSFRISSFMIVLTRRYRRTVLASFFNKSARYSLI